MLIYGVVDNWLCEQYEILFGEKKKKDPNAEPVASFNVAAQQNAAANNNSNAQAVYAGNVALGLTNDPDQYMLNNARVNEGRPAPKKRVHRGFQQLLKKDQMSYIPPSLPLYQHGVRAVNFLFLNCMDLFWHVEVVLTGCGYSDGDAWWPHARTPEPTEPLGHSPVAD